MSTASNAGNTGHHGDTYDEAARIDALDAMCAAINSGTTSMADIEKLLEPLGFGPYEIFVMLKSVGATVTIDT